MDSPGVEYWMRMLAEEVEEEEDSGERSEMPGLRAEMERLQGLAARSAVKPPSWMTPEEEEDRRRQVQWMLRQQAMKNLREAEEEALHGRQKQVGRSKKAREMTMINQMLTAVTPACGLELAEEATLQEAEEENLLQEAEEANLQEAEEQNLLQEAEEQNLLQEAEEENLQEAEEESVHGRQKPVAMMDSTAGKPHTPTEAEESALEVPMMDSTAGEPHTPTEAQESALEVAMMDSTGMRTEAEEQIALQTRNAERELAMAKAQAEKKAKARAKAKAERKAKAMDAKDKARAKAAKAMAAKAKAKSMEAKAKAKDEEARKAQVSVTQGEAVAVGSSNSAMEDEVMCKETLQQLIKDMPTESVILYADDDDEKDEMIESAIEQEHVPSDGKNPSDRDEEPLTEVVKEGEEGALLIGIGSTAGGSSTWKEADKAVEEIRQILQHIALLGIKEIFAKKEAALLAGIYPTSGKFSMVQKQAEYESGKKSEMQQQAEEDMIDYFTRLPPQRCQRALKQYYAMKYEAAQWKALVAEVEKRKTFLASQEKSARRDKAKAKAALALAKAALAKAKAIEEAGEPEASETESGTPEESVAEAGRPEETVTVGSSKSAADVMGKETMQQLLKDTSNRFAILDLVGDDETDEIGRHELAIEEEERMPSDGMNRSDRGEESMTVGSGKSAMDQEVMRRALLDIQERWANKKKNNNPDKEALQQMVQDLSENFDISVRSSSAMVESDKMLFLQPANSSFTDPMTRLGVQDDRSKSSPKETPDEEMASEAKYFDKYRRGWESAWKETCGPFGLMTALSSMQFTYYTPGRTRWNYAASTPPTLQICSIKLTEIAGGLRWPLSVYGVVAVRDVVDRNRNFLFSSEREDSQELTKDDPFLRLIGPSRAVVFTDKVNIEIQLKVKGPTGSQDKPLITEACRYNEGFNNVSAVCFKNCFCTMELCMQVVRKTIQATILGVQFVRDGRSPFEYGARVTCSPVPGKQLGFAKKSTSGEIVMVDSKDGEILYGSDGYIHLPRSVVSVETEGRLDVNILAYSKSGKIAAQGHASFLPQFSKISQRKCSVCGVDVVITVAWSLVATDKFTFMSLGRLSCVA